MRLLSVSDSYLKRDAQSLPACDGDRTYHDELLLIEKLSGREINVFNA